MSRIEWRSWYTNAAETSYSKDHAFELRADFALCGASLPRGKRYSMWDGETCQHCQRKLENRGDS